MLVSGRVHHAKELQYEFKYHTDPGKDRIWTKYAELNYRTKEGKRTKKVVKRTCTILIPDKTSLSILE